MFTGIVQAVGVVSQIDPTPTGRRLWVDPGSWRFVPAAGDSIAVDGCCLTVVEVRGGRWAFDAVPETLAKTTLAGWTAGKKVNLEHAATASTFLGGHIVQGHVDGVGTIASVRQTPDWRVRVQLPASLAEYMVPKGSVALAGVSLTLAEVNPREGWIEVALIPATLEKTDLADLQPGEGINVEADSMAKTMIHWMRNYASSKA